MHKAGMLNMANWLIWGKLPREKNYYFLFLLQLTSAKEWRFQRKSKRGWVCASDMKEISCLGTKNREDGRVAATWWARMDFGSFEKEEVKWILVVSAVGGSGGVWSCEESPLQPKDKWKERSNENCTAQRMSGKRHLKGEGSRPLRHR